MYLVLKSSSAIMEATPTTAAQTPWNQSTQHLAADAGAAGGAACALAWYLLQPLRRLDRLPVDPRQPPLKRDSFSFAE